MRKRPKGRARIIEDLQRLATAERRKARPSNGCRFNHRQYSEEPSPARRGKYGGCTPKSAQPGHGDRLVQSPPDVTARHGRASNPRGVRKGSIKQVRSKSHRDTKKRWRAPDDESAGWEAKSLKLLARHERATTVEALVSTPLLKRTVRPKRRERKRAECAPPHGE
jgi:hypothetical protein